MSYPKSVVIILIISKFIFLYTKVIKTIEGELTFDVFKEYMYENLICLMLSWWWSNMIYNTYYISKDGIHIIRNNFGNFWSYGSRFLAIWLGHNTYTYPSRVKRVYFTPIQEHLLKNDINFYYKRDLFYFIPQILAEKIINNITIKDFYASRIIDSDILKNHGEYYETLCVCGQSMFAFVTRKQLLGYKTHLMLTIGTDT